jgi:hypothetical protein
MKDTEKSYYLVTVFRRHRKTHLKLPHNHRKDLQFCTNSTCALHCTFLILLSGSTCNIGRQIRLYLYSLYGIITSLLCRVTFTLVSQASTTSNNKVSQMCLKRKVHANHSCLFLGLLLRQNRTMKGTFVVGDGAREDGGIPKTWEFSTKDRIGHGSFGSIYLGETARFYVASLVFFFFFLFFI